MRRILMIITQSCVSLPAFAAENELRLGVTTASRYSDNAANVSSGKEDTFSFVIGPRLIFDTA